MNMHTEQSSLEIQDGKEFPEEQQATRRYFQSQSKKQILIFLALILIVTGMVSGIFLLRNTTGNNRSSAASSDWKLTDFSCRLKITIVATTKEINNTYPAKVVVDQNALARLPQNCKPKANFDDIRFTSLDGIELPYARRANQQSTAMNFHVKLPQLTATTTIWMYVGNKNAASTENPRETFAYFQDFNSFNPTVKFGVFTDLHHDGVENHYWTAPDGKSAALRDAQDRLTLIVNRMNQWNADFIVSLGDLITAENFSPQNVAPFPNPPTQMTGELTAKESEYDMVAKSLNDFRTVESIYKTFNGPRYYVASNHDFYFATEDQLLKSNAAILGGQGAVLQTKASGEYAQSSHFVFDRGGVRFIGIDLQFDPDNKMPDGTFRHRGNEGGSNYGEGFMPPWELEWLNTQLSTAPGPVMILSPSHLEDSEYLEDNFPEEGNSCATQLNDNYCTDRNCQSNPASCVNLCKDLGEYRRVRNAPDIRAILEKYPDKVLMVLQGNDHARASYTQNGIQYLTLDGAESIEAKDVSYLQLEIDPVQHLVALYSYGKDNTYSVSYSNGKMQLSSSIANEFVTVPIGWGGTWGSDTMVQADWEMNPTEPAQQLGLGFATNADLTKINHRCAVEGRPKKNNLVGVRRVFANKAINNFIGSEIIQNGQSTTSLEFPTTKTAGTFWVQNSNNSILMWYGEGASNEGGQLKTIATTINGFSPAIWVFDNATATVDNLTVRAAIYPEPVGSISNNAEVRGRTAAPKAKIIQIK